MGKQIYIYIPNKNTTSADMALVESDKEINTNNIKEKLIKKGYNNPILIDETDKIGKTLKVDKCIINIDNKPRIIQSVIKGAIVFKDGKHYPHMMDKPPWTTLNNLNTKPIRKYKINNIEFSINPQSLFKDALYITAITQNPTLKQAIQQTDAIIVETDNPDQLHEAWSIALASSLLKQNPNIKITLETASDTLKQYAKEYYSQQKEQEIKIYAASGAKIISEEDQEEITQLALILDKQGYTLRTKKEIGTTQAFAQGSANKEIYTENNIPDNKSQEITDIAFQNTENWEHKYMKFHIRNTTLITGQNNNETIKFLLIFSPEGNIRKDNETEIRTARKLNVPIIILTENFKKEHALEAIEKSQKQQERIITPIKDSNKQKHEKCVYKTQDGGTREIWILSKLIDEYYAGITGAKDKIKDLILQKNINIIEGKETNKANTEPPQSKEIELYPTTIRGENSEIYEYIDENNAKIKIWIADKLIENITEQWAKEIIKDIIKQETIKAQKNFYKNNRYICIGVDIPNTEDEMEIIEADFNKKEETIEARKKIMHARQIINEDDWRTIKISKKIATKDIEGYIYAPEWYIEKNDTETYSITDQDRQKIMDTYIQQQPKPKTKEEQEIIQRKAHAKAMETLTITKEGKILAKHTDKLEIIYQNIIDYNKKELLKQYGNTYKKEHTPITNTSKDNNISKIETLNITKQKTNNKDTNIYTIIINKNKKDEIKFNYTEKQTKILEKTWEKTKTVDTETFLIIKTIQKNKTKKQTPEENNINAEDFNIEKMPFGSKITLKDSIEIYCNIEETNKIEKEKEKQETTTLNNIIKRGEEYKHKLTYKTIRPINQEKTQTNEEIMAGLKKSLKNINI